jgi:hypothetical protein
LNAGSVALLLRYCDRIAGYGSPRLDTVTQQSPVSNQHFVGWAFVLACMTRYEAWPVTIGSLAVAIFVLWRRGMAPSAAARAIGRVAIYPVVAIVGFAVFSRVVVGSWFASGFFVPENPAQGDAIASVKEIVWGVRELSGNALVVAAMIGGTILAGGAFSTRTRAHYLLVLALLGTAAVPWSAFMDGHPYRIRYMVPLIATQAIFAGIAAGAWKRGRVVLSVALLAAAAMELRPLNLSVPMVAEAQWDSPNIAGRAPVTACLKEGYRGESVMASMGSLGHYMQALANDGFALRDFLHEGNGDIWLDALVSPRPFAGWILVEEKAEGGDMLAKIIGERPQFLDGYRRVCEGAGLALYRRDATSNATQQR